MAKLLEKSVGETLSFVNGYNQIAYINLSILRWLACQLLSDSFDRLLPNL